MNIENISNNEIAKKPHAYIEFGGPGHETEYVFTVQPNMYSQAQNLPYEWEDDLKEKLGDDWSIMNRGHRIEIVPPNFIRTDETTSSLLKAIKEIINDNECQFIEKG